MSAEPEASGRLPGPPRRDGVAALLALLSLGVGLAGCAPRPETSPNARISTATRLSIADIAAAGGDLESARTILEAAAQADPTNGNLQLRYAQTLLDLGRPQDAVNAARQAPQRAPNDVKLAVRTAQLELRAGNPVLAAATFQGIVSHGGGGPAALNGLGVARVQLADLPGAEDAFRRAVALAPGDYASRNNLALSLVLQGRAAEAVPMLQSLADQPGIPGRVKHNLALAYAEQGATQQATGALAGVVGGSDAAREVAAFTALRTEAPTQVAAKLAPAEIIDGLSSGAAYAGTLPPPAAPQAEAATGAATGAAVAAAPAAAAHPEVKLAEIRPVPVGPVQAAPMPPPDAPPVPAAAAPTLPPPSLSGAPAAKTAESPDAGAPIARPTAAVAAAPAPAPAPATTAPTASPPASVAVASLAASPPQADTQVVTPLASAPILAPVPLAPSPGAGPVGTLGTPVPLNDADSKPSAAAVGRTSMAVTEPADDGTIKVRIAVLPSRWAALALWENLSGLEPDLLTGRTPLVKMAFVQEKLAWNLGTGGFQNIAAAEQFCARLRERGQDCSLGL